MSALAHPTESAIETLRLTAGAVTDPAGRDENQDIGIALQLVAPADDGLPGEGFLLIVADGMGGHPFGDVASRIATDALMTVFTTIPEGDLGQALKQAYRQANEAIAREVEREPAQAGMGTTLTTALLRGKYATIANIGDSRAYLLRGDGLTQVTRDHTVIAEELAAGRIKPDAARTDPRRNMLTQALGTQARLDSKLPNIYELTLLPGDRLLLCSDGLYGVLDDTEMSRALHSPDPDEAARRLVDEAKRRGTSDNATAVVAAAIPTRTPVTVVSAPPSRTGGIPGTVLFISLGILLIVLVVIAVFVLGAFQ